MSRNCNDICPLKKKKKVHKFLCLCVRPFICPSTHPFHSFSVVVNVWSWPHYFHFIFLQYFCDLFFVPATVASQKALKQITIDIIFLFSSYCWFYFAFAFRSGCRRWWSTLTFCMSLIIVAFLVYLNFFFLWILSFFCWCCKLL